MDDGRVCLYDPLRHEDFAQHVESCAALTLLSPKFLHTLGGLRLLNSRQIGVGPRRHLLARHQVIAGGIDIALKRLQRG